MTKYSTFANEMTPKQAHNLEDAHIIFRGAPEGHISRRIELAVLWVQKIYKERLPLHAASYKARQSSIDMEYARVEKFTDAQIKRLQRKKYTYPNESRKELMRMIIQRASVRFDVSARIIKKCIGNYTYFK